MKKSKVVLIGNFDGIHLGHQKLISKAKKIAEQKKQKLVLITFNPHPREIINNIQMDLILPYKEKKLLLKNYGIDKIDEIKFTNKLSKLSAEEFAKEYIYKAHNPSDIVIGKNFKFGHKARGDAKLLKDSLSKKVKVHSIDIKRLDSLVISSSEIKKLISKGNIDKVNKLLGRNYHISGKVIHGEKRGRLIGFPTTNLSTEWNFLPKKGVYVSKVVISDKSYQSITNIGVRPTFNANSLQIESHIFDFNKNVYGKKIKIYFLARIRSEKKFETVEKLIENITKDVNFGRKYFKNFR
ncbi:MAG: bifunctional riboflavin kinase/FAD synthetase [Thermodesulfobacteriota bacterium]|nr:bifunctional riboflavin kinase/FAD synthetase [Thermodesulfobacteriota bacterium]NSW96614.1 bifunctional riboflavin kinase/FAD synthetase [bacterium]|tara:strand:+ start:851 stop:1738 length:888 start_codon:yes stop_codon:yes gene_type:complete